MAPKSWIDTIDRAQYMELSTKLQQYQVVLVIGPPGSGKTSSIPWAAVRARQYQLQRDEVRVDCTVPRRQQAQGMKKYLEREDALF